MHGALEPVIARDRALRPVNAISTQHPVESSVTTGAALAIAAV